MLKPSILKNQQGHGIPIRVVDTGPIFSKVHMGRD
jgi:hypothetical protein